MAEDRDDAPDFSRVHEMKVHPDPGPIVRTLSFLAIYGLFVGVFAGVAAALPFLTLVATGMLAPELWESADGWVQQDSAAAMRRRALFGGLAGVVTCATIIFLAQRGITFRRDQALRGARSKGEVNPRVAGWTMRWWR